MLWKSAAARRLLEMADKPPTVEEAVVIVSERLLDGIRCPPTDLEAIAPRLDVTCIRAEDVPFSGELRRDGTGFTVVYSSALSPGRRRFTVAHEMAHALFEDKRAELPTCWQGVGAALRQDCGRVAYATQGVPRMCWAGCFRWRGVRACRMFGLSLSATAIRCAELKGVSVFEVDGDAVTWGHGIVKRGPIQAVEYMVRHALIDALPLERRDHLGLHGEPRLEGRMAAGVGPARPRPTSLLPSAAGLRIPRG